MSSIGKPPFVDQRIEPFQGNKRGPGRLEIPRVAFSLF